MGAFHEGHLSLMRRARERVRRGGRLAVRQPDPVQRGRRPRRPTRATRSRDAMLAADGGVDYLFAPSAEEIYPDGFATHRQRRRHDGDARGRAARPRPLRRRHDRRDEAVQHRRARRRLLRPEGRPAGAGHPAARARPQPRRARSRSARRCASPTAWRCRAATAPRARTSAQRATALSRALAAAAGAGRRRARPTLQTSLAAARAELDEPVVQTEYLQIVNPDTLVPINEHRRARAGAGRGAGLASTRLIDNQRSQSIQRALDRQWRREATRGELTCRRIPHRSPSSRTRRACR